MNDSNLKTMCDYDLRELCNLIDATKSHQEWVTLMTFGMKTLTLEDNQGFLLKLILRELVRHPEHSAGINKFMIMDELNLTFKFNGPQTVGIYRSIPFTNKENK